MPYVVGGDEVYQQQTSWPVVLENSEVVVLWSANPLNTLKIAWNASDEQGLAYFEALRGSGKRLICIDPMRSESVDFFGEKMEWIAPHMGTDVALMLGIAHTLVENGWHDADFLAGVRPDMTVLLTICWANLTMLQKRQNGPLKFVVFRRRKYVNLRRYFTKTPPC